MIPGKLNFNPPSMSRYILADVDPRDETSFRDLQQGFFLKRQRAANPSLDCVPSRRLKKPKLNLQDQERIPKPVPIPLNLGSRLALETIEMNEFSYYTMDRALKEIPDILSHPYIKDVVPRDVKDLRPGFKQFKIPFIGRTLENLLEPSGEKFHIDQIRKIAFSVLKALEAFRSIKKEHPYLTARHIYVDLYGKASIDPRSMLPKGGPKKRDLLSLKEILDECTRKLPEVDQNDGAFQDFKKFTKILAKSKKDNEIEFLLEHPFLMNMKDCVITLDKKNTGADLTPFYVKLVNHQPKGYFCNSQQKSDCFGAYPIYRSQAFILPEHIDEIKNIRLVIYQGKPCLTDPKHHKHLNLERTNKITYEHYWKGSQLPQEIHLIAHNPLK